MRFIILSQALAIRRALLDPQDPAIASSLDALASYHRRLGERALARRLYQEALDIVMAARGEKHPHTLTVLSNLAGVLEDSEEKIATMQRVLDLRQEILPDSVETAIAWNNLGVIYLKAGRRGEAQQALEAGLELLVEHLGVDHWQIGNTMNNLGTLHELEGRNAEALPCLERGLALIREARGADHIETGLILTRLAQVLAKLDRPEEALHAARQGLETVRKAAPAPSRPLADTLLKLGRVLLAAGSAAEAEATFRRALAMGRDLQILEDLWFAEANAGLGRAMAALGRGQEARPLLVEAEARLKGWVLADPFYLQQLRAVLEE